MEGVRATAQGAIDQANALFQALRQDATHTLDNAIHYLQNRFFSLQTLVCTHSKPLSQPPVQPWVAGLWGMPMPRLGQDLLLP